VKKLEEFEGFGRFDEKFVEKGASFPSFES